MAGSGPRFPEPTLRIFAIEALWIALPRSCRKFVAAVRANADVFEGLASPDLYERLGAVEPFSAWMADTFPALAWLRRGDGLRPPFASDNGVGTFAVGVVPWILAGAVGEPPRTRLEWERENVLVDLRYRDRLRYLNSHRPEDVVEPLDDPSGSAALAPVAFRLGESEREFVARARAHARARQRDFERYVANDPTHPLHAEAARLYSTGDGPRPYRYPDVPLLHRPRQLELHATWWALHHVEGQTAAEIAGHVETERNVQRQIAAMSRYYQ